MASGSIKRTTMLAASVLATGALFVSGAGAANAATPAPSPQVKTNGMTFYDDFWTLDGCKTAGEWGLDEGKWTLYDCQESPWDWDLYVDS